MWCAASLLPFFSFFLFASCFSFLDDTKKCELIQESWNMSFSSYNLTLPKHKQTNIFLAPHLPKELIHSLSQHHSIFHLDPSNPALEELVHLFLLNSVHITNSSYNDISFPTEHEITFSEKFPSLISSLFSHDILVGPLASALAPLILWINPNTKIILSSYFPNKEDEVNFWRKELASYRLLVGFEPTINNNTLPYMAWQVDAVAKSLILCLFQPQSLCEVHLAEGTWCLSCGKGYTPPQSNSKKSLDLPLCSFSPFHLKVCPWVKRSWEKMMSQYFIYNTSSSNTVIVCGSEGTTATRYLFTLSGRAGLKSQHFKKGISQELFQQFNENLFTDHQIILRVLEGLEEIEFLSDAPVPLYSPMLLWRNPQAKLMLSWRPFNEWIFSRVNSHTYRSLITRLSGSMQRVHPLHPRAPLWSYYAGNNMMLSCLKSGSQFIEVRLFDAPKTSDEDLKEFFLSSSKQNELLPSEDHKKIKKSGRKKPGKLFFESNQKKNPIF